MTTKEYLGQIRRYDHMIANKLEEISRFRSMAIGAPVSTDSERVQSSGSKDKVCSYISRIVDMERSVDVIIDKRYEIVQQIEHIEDSRMYDVLAQRFILFRDLKEIELDGAESLPQVKRIYYDALVAFEEKYGNLYLKCS